MCLDLGITLLRTQVSFASLYRTIKIIKYILILLERRRGIVAALNSNPLLISFPMTPTNRKWSQFQSGQHIRHKASNG